MEIVFPSGFRGVGVHCGLKQDATREDLTLIVTDMPVTAAGVYTQNVVVAAPVTLDRQRTPADDVRLVVANSGNANACTGEQGLADARHMARLAAAACDASEEQSLVLSTGIIGELLPMDKIAVGISHAAGELGTTHASVVSAARGLMTTDTTHKIAHRTVPLGEAAVSIVGLAKGAAMIGPNMATMLAVVMTDAKLSPPTAQKMLAQAVDRSFNCIRVEGHTSTNDTVLLLASGCAQKTAMPSTLLEGFEAALNELCIELARAIPADGEGASHLVQVQVQGCATRDNAKRIATAIADSPLVKTAVTGADPNWGRVISAAGYAGIPFDPQSVDLKINGTCLYEQGTPVEFNESAVSQSIRDNRETHILLQLGEGHQEATMWTCDLTEEYIRLNTDYHT